MIPQPKPNTYPSYFEKYTSLVKDEVMTSLKKQRKKFKKFILSDFDPDYFYAPGKWTVRQSIVHIIDTERVFTYRAMAISRGEKQSLPGFDQDKYTDHDWGHLSKEQLWREFSAVRRSTIALFKNMNPDMLEKIGKVAGNDFSVCAVPYICAGHLIHHMNIFKSKYGL